MEGLSYIEQRLQELTEKKEELKPYYEYWLHSKRYLSDVLNTITHIFPHYTLHDATHSQMILDNVVSILGEKVVDKWSVGDCWLMLMTVYFHDCGMFVSSGTKDLLFQAESGETFREFIQECQENPQSPMHKAATAFEIKSDGIYFRSQKLTAESYEYPKTLIAEYIRRRHADRVGEFVAKAEKDLGWHKVPRRLLSVVDKISQCHAKPQEELMKLPFSEKFVGSVCHPRYIAAMLRLGDVLDIDSNRIPQTVLDTMSYIPKDSKWHLSMNLSVTHIRIDEKITEVSAGTKDRKTAELTMKWFGMIESEIQYQLNQRYNIMPEQYGYTLPQVGAMNVQLEGYDELDGNKFPQFEVDTDRAMHLLEGSDLYNHPAQCMREVFQNAVDATYLRIYCEHFRGKEITENSFQEFCSYCANIDYQISVEIKHEDGLLKFKISDKGIGMGKEDLRFIAKIGSSKKNTVREQLIKEMPDWMRPSGTFGIGFQSLFLMTDEVTLTTQKWNTNIAHEVKLYKPETESEYRGNILIKTNKEALSANYGTIIEFSVPDKKWFGMGKHNLQGYSLEEAFEMEIQNSLESYLQASWVKIDYTYSPPSSDLHKLYVKQEFGELYNILHKSSTYYVQVAFNQVTKRPLEVFYRNQRIENSKLSLERYEAIPLSVNLLSLQASEVLGMSRNEIKEKMADVLKDVINKAILQFLEKKMEDETLSVAQKSLVAMMLVWNNIEAGKKNAEWSTLQIRYQYKSADQRAHDTIDSLFRNNVRRVKFEMFPYEYQDRISILCSLKGKGKKPEERIVLGLSDLPKYKKIYQFIEYIASRYYFNKITLQGKVLYMDKTKDKKPVVVVLSQEPKKADYKKNIINAKKKKKDETKEQYLTFLVNHMKRYPLRRYCYLPCPDEYKSLEIRLDEIKILEEDKWFPYAEISYPILLSPYVLDEKEGNLELKCICSEIFYTKVQEKLKKSIEIEEIKQLYEKFIAEWQSAVNNVQQQMNNDNLAEYL